ncbi:MAG TPA: alpha-L-fucosidase [Gemmatimonadales bacterium]|jgi:alpha-L-fucosidase
MDRRSFLTLTSAAACSAILSRRVEPPRPRPSPEQLAWQRRELSLFLPFGLSTFTGQEWGEGTEDPMLFLPEALDVRQWVRAAKAGGFGTLMLTAKHRDGFCLWPSQVTGYSIRASRWRDGRGDLVGELASACRAEQLGFGFYLSPWDRNAPSYGDSPRYNDFYCEQLAELLTRYGPIAEVRFDGAAGEGPGGGPQVYDWPRIYALVRKYQPAALIFSDAGPDLRWIGDEGGKSGDPNWCAVDPGVVPYPGVEGPAVRDMLQHGDPDGTVWRPAESEVSIRPHWFWHPEDDGQVRSSGDLMDLYFASVGRNAALRLGVPPTRAGLLQDSDVRHLTEFGNVRERLFMRDLTVGAVRSQSDRGHQMRLILPRAVEFDVVMLEEEIDRGQTVSAHHVDVRREGAWLTVAEGTTIGSKRLHRIPGSSASDVRLVIEASIGDPHIRRFSLHTSLQ